jgi:CRP-like cAMP-binding protein
MDVFAPVRSMEVRSLAGPVLEVSIPAGTELMHEGRLLGTFYVIRAGSAELRRGPDTVRVLGTGDCFGEISPVAQRPQRFSVVASSPMRVLTFSAFGIGRLCAAFPAVRQRLIASLPDATT